MAQGCKAAPGIPLIERQRLFDVHIHVGLQNEEFHGVSLAPGVGAAAGSCWTQGLPHNHAEVVELSRGDLSDRMGAGGSLGLCLSAVTLCYACYSHHVHSELTSCCGARLCIFSYHWVTRQSKSLAICLQLRTASAVGRQHAHPGAELQGLLSSVADAGAVVQATRMTASGLGATSRSGCWWSGAVTRWWTPPGHC